MDPPKKRRSRKISVRYSIGNRSRLSSSTSYVTPAATRRRINSLQKNNKMLAAALQDCRCELSNKRELLQESVEYLNKTNIAKCQLLEMHCVLQSFTKKFEETLLLLQFEDSMWAKFGHSNKFCKNFIQKMKPVVEEVTEGLVDQVISPPDENILDGSSDQFKENTKSAPAMPSPMESDSTILYSEFEEPIGEVESTTEKTSPGRLSLVKSHNEKHALEVKSFPSEENHQLHRESPIKICTDKTTVLSSEKVQICAMEKTPEMKSVSSGENCPLPAKNTKKVLANQTAMLSSQKVSISKIPRFHDSCKAKKQSQIKEISKGITLGKRKLAENLTSNNIRRKTFVVKENEVQSTVPSNQHAPDLENLGYTMPDMDKKTSPRCRETFVIKASDIPEGDEDIFGVDRRKTFVKKTNNKPISCENKQKQLVMSEHASEVKEKEDVDFSKLPDVIIPLQMLSTEAVNDILSKKYPDTNLQSPVKEKSISPKNEQLDNITVLNNVNITPEVLSEPMLDLYDNVHAKGPASNASIETKGKKLKEPGVEVLEDKRIGIFGQKEATDVENIPRDDLAKINIDDATGARPRKSFKIYFESSSSSSSDCEILDDIDFSPAVPVITTFPIRGYISSSKPKKVFNFNVKKRKSILKNKSSVKNIHSKGNQLDLDNVNIKSKNDIKSKDARSEGLLQENDSNKNTYPDSSNSKQKKSKAVKTNRYKSKNKDTNTAVVDCLMSSASTHCVDNEYLNDASPTSEVCDKTPPSVALNKHVSDDTEQSKNNDDPPVVNEFRCIDETDKCKSKEAKVISKDIPVDDITRKKSKKITKKKKENISLETDAVISKFTDDDLNLPQVSQNKSSLAKGSNANKKENIEPQCKRTGRNTFLVHAEIHSPPPLLSASETENKENAQETQNMQVSDEKENVPGIKNLQVSVVLSDIFKDGNSIDLPESVQEKHNGKTLLSDCAKIPPTPDNDSLTAHNNAGTTSNESSNGRRLRGKKSHYKEPSLNKKMRR